jgi:hypothetical protein
MRDIAGLRLANSSMGYTQTGRRIVAMPLTMIEEYEVMYSSLTFSPRIGLKAGGNFIGQPVFEPNGSPLPNDNATSLHYHLEDFHNILDLLRNEQPTYLLFSGSGPGFENGIKTTAELVGEGRAELSLDPRCVVTC